MEREFPLLLLKVSSQQKIIKLFTKNFFLQFPADSLKIPTIQTFSFTSVASWLTAPSAVKLENCRATIHDRFKSSQQFSTQKAVGTSRSTRTILMMRRRSSRTISMKITTSKCSSKASDSLSSCPRHHRSKLTEWNSTNRQFRDVPNMPSELK